MRLISDPDFHFHSEYQLFIVLEGTGARFIGDHVSPFKKVDLVFTDPGLPHVWRSDMEYLEGNKQLTTEGWPLQVESQLNSQKEWHSTHSLFATRAILKPESYRFTGYF